MMCVDGLRMVSVTSVSGCRVISMELVTEEADVPDTPSNVAGGTRRWGYFTERKACGCSSSSGTSPPILLIHLVYWTYHDVVL